MPYEGEFAHYESVRRIVQNPHVEEFLTRCEALPAGETVDGATLVPETIGPSDWLPQYVVAIDGSHQEAAIRNGFPGAEISYLSVACVILDVAKMRELDARRPVDPAAFNRLRASEAVDAVFPGCNVAFKGGSTPQATLREQFFETLGQNQMFSGGETVLDTFEALRAHADARRRFECPESKCKAPDGRAARGTGRYACDCELGTNLLSTDALRFHVGMADVGPNGAMFAEISQVLEHLWLVNMLRSIEAEGWLSSLKRIAFFMDGPLGVFGHPAWLSQAIEVELRRLNQAARQENGTDILLLGVEKSGAFATHFEMLDVEADGEPHRWPPRTLFLLNDEYIKKRIQLSARVDDTAEASGKMYGKDTYYGRKFLYKTSTGARIVGVSPYFHEGDDDLRRAEPSQHPRLADALHLLDDLVSARYPNAIVPIIEAHAHAAIPMNLGKRVLEGLARSLVT